MLDCAADRRSPGQAIVFRGGRLGRVGLMSTAVEERLQIEPFLRRTRQRDLQRLQPRLSLGIAAAMTLASLQIGVFQPPQDENPKRHGRWRPPLSVPCFRLKALLAYEGQF